MTYLDDIQINNGSTNLLMGVNDLQSFAQLPLSLPTMGIDGLSALNKSASLIPNSNKQYYSKALEERLIGANKYIDTKLPILKPLMQTIEALESPLVGTIIASKIYNTYKQNKELYSNKRFGLSLAGYQGYNVQSIQDYQKNKLTRSDAILSKIGLNGFVNTEKITNLNMQSQASYNQYAEALSNVNTVLRLGKNEIREYGKTIQELTEKDLKNTVKSVEALAAAYEAASAGYIKPKDNQQVMVAGLKLAKSGNADSGEVMRLLTQTMNTYGASADEASKYAAKFNGIVEKGITTIRELSNYLGETAVVAKSAGVNINEVGAAIATMTTKGMGTAEANTSLQGLMMTVIDKSPTASKTIRDLNKGIEREEDKIKLDRFTIENDPDGQGLIKELKKINRLTKGNSSLASDIFTNIQAYKGYSVLMNDKGKTLDSNFESIKNTVSSNLDKVFGIRIDNQNEQFNRIFNRIEESYIKIGSQIEPFFDKSINSLENFVDKITKTSEMWSSFLPAITKAKASLENFATALANITKTIVGGLLVYNMARLGGLIQSLVASGSYLFSGKDTGIGGRIKKVVPEILGLNQLGFNREGSVQLDPSTGGYLPNESAIYNRYRASQLRNYITTWLPFGQQIENIGKVGSNILGKTGLFGNRFGNPEVPDLFLDKEGNIVRMPLGQMDSSSGALRSYYRRPEYMTDSFISKALKDNESSESYQSFQKMVGDKKVLKEANQIIESQGTKIIKPPILGKAFLVDEFGNPKIDKNYTTFQESLLQNEKLKLEERDLRSSIKNIDKQVTNIDNQLLNTNLLPADRTKLEEEKNRLIQNKTEKEAKINEVKNKRKVLQGERNKIATSTISKTPYALIDLDKEDKTNRVNRLKGDALYQESLKENKKLKLEERNMRASLKETDSKIKDINTQLLNPNLTRSEISVLNSQKQDLELEKLNQESAITNIKNQRKTLLSERKNIASQVTINKGLGTRVYVFDQEGNLVVDKNNEKYESNVKKTTESIDKTREINSKLKDVKRKQEKVEKELQNTNLPQENQKSLKEEQDKLNEKEKELRQKKEIAKKERKVLSKERKAIVAESPLIRETPYATVASSDETQVNKDRRKIYEDRESKLRKDIENQRKIIRGEIPENYQTVYTGINEKVIKRQDANSITYNQGYETEESKRYRLRTEQLERQMYGSKKDLDILESPKATAKQKEQALKRLNQKVNLGQRREQSASPLALTNSFLKGITGRETLDIAEGKVTNASQSVSISRIQDYQNVSNLSFQQAKSDLFLREEQKLENYRKRLTNLGVSGDELEERVALRKEKWIENETYRQWIKQEEARTGRKMSLKEAKAMITGSGMKLVDDGTGYITAVGKGNYNAVRFAGKIGSGARELIGSSGLGQILATGVVLGAVGKVTESFYDLSNKGYYGQAEETYKKIQNQNYQTDRVKEKEALLKDLETFDKKKEQFLKYSTKNNINLVTSSSELAKQNIESLIKNKEQKLESTKSDKEKELLNLEINNLKEELKNVESNKGDVKTGLDKVSSKKIRTEITISENALTKLEEEIKKSESELNNLSDKEKNNLSKKIDYLKEQKRLEEELLSLKKDSLALLQGEELTRKSIAKQSGMFADTLTTSYESNWKKGQFNNIGSISGNGFSNLALTGGLGGLGLLGGLALGSLGVASGGMIPLALAVGGTTLGLLSSNKIKETQTSGGLSIYDVDEYARTLNILDKKGKRVRKKGALESGADNIADFLGTLVGDHSGAYEDFFNKGLAPLHKNIEKTSKLAKLYSDQSFGELKGYKVNPAYKEIEPLSDYELGLIDKAEQGKLKGQVGNMFLGALSGAVKGALIGGVTLGTTGAIAGSVGGPVGSGVGGFSLGTVGLIGGGIVGAVRGGYKGYNQEKSDYKKAIERQKEIDKYKNVPENIQNADLSTSLENLDIFGKNVSSLSDTDLETLKKSITSYREEATGKLNEAIGNSISADEARIKDLEQTLEQLYKKGGNLSEGENKTRQSAESELSLLKQKTEENKSILNDRLKELTLAEQKVEEISLFNTQYRRNLKGVSYLGEAAKEDTTEKTNELIDIQKRIDTSSRDFTRKITDSEVATYAFKNNLTKEEARKELEQKKKDSLSLLSEEFSTATSGVLESFQSNYDSGLWSNKEYITNINKLLNEKDNKYLDTTTRDYLLTTKASLLENIGQEKASSLDLSNQILSKKLEAGFITEESFNEETIKNQIEANNALIKSKKEALELLKSSGKLNKEREEEALKEIELLKAENNLIKEKTKYTKEYQEISKKEVEASIKELEFNSKTAIYGLDTTNSLETLKDINTSKLNIVDSNIKIAEQEYKDQVAKTGEDSLEAKKKLLTLNNFKNERVNLGLDNANNIQSLFNSNIEKKNNLLELNTGLGISTSQEASLLNGINKDELQSINEKYNSLTEFNKKLGIKGLTKEQQEKKDLEIIQSKYNYIIRTNSLEENKSQKESNKFNTIKTFSDIGYQIDTNLLEDSRNKSYDTLYKALDTKYTKLANLNKNKKLTKEQEDNKLFESYGITASEVQSIYTTADIINKPLVQSIDISERELNNLIEELQKGGNNLESEINKSITQIIKDKQEQVKKQYDYIEKELKKRGIELPDNFYKEKDLAQKEVEKEASTLRDQLKDIQATPEINKLKSKIYKDQLYSGFYEEQISLKNKNIELQQNKLGLQDFISSNLKLPQELAPLQDFIFEKSNLTKEYEVAKLSNTATKDTFELVKRNNTIKENSILLDKKQLEIQKSKENITKDEREQIELQLSFINKRLEVTKDNNKLEVENITRQKEINELKEKQLKTQLATLTSLEKEQKLLTAITIKSNILSSKQSSLQGYSSLIDSTMGLVSNNFGDNGTARDLIYDLLNAKEKSLAKQAELNLKLLDIEEKKFKIEQASLQINLEKQKLELEENLKKAKESKDSNKIKEAEDALNTQKEIIKYNKELYNSTKDTFTIQRELYQREIGLEALNLKSDKLNISYNKKDSDQLIKDIKNYANSNSNLLGNNTVGSNTLENIIDNTTKKQKEGLDRFNIGLENLESNKRSRSGFTYYDGISDIEKTLRKQIAEQKEVDFNLEAFKKDADKEVLSTNSVARNKETKESVVNNNDNSTYNQKFEIKIEVKGGANSSPQSLGKEVAKSFEENMSNFLDKLKTKQTQYNY